MDEMDKDIAAVLGVRLTRDFELTCQRILKQKAVIDDAYQKISGKWNEDGLTRDDLYTKAAGRSFAVFSCIDDAYEQHR